MAKVIAICNQKGGVGKTTTAINLSSFLALLGKKTLLLDIDPQGNATSGVGLDKTSLEKSIYHVLLKDSSIRDVIRPTELGNLKIAPSNVDLTGFEVELHESPVKEFLLKEAITDIKAEFDFIIVDSPPSLGLLTINALTASDSVLIPIQCEYYALEGLSQLLKIISLVRDRLNQALSIEGVLLTMADYRTRLTTEVINEVRKYFDSDEGRNQVGEHGRVYKTIISRSIRLSEAPGFGKPIALYDKAASGAIQYENLAKEVLGIEPQTSSDHSGELAEDSADTEKLAIEGPNLSEDKSLSEGDI
jgi:chromosome partitioning protein